MNTRIEKYAKEIQRATDALYYMLGGEKKSHSEVFDKASQIIEIIIPSVCNEPEYKIILNKIIDKYELEVGIKRYEPIMIVNNKTNSSWLHEIKNKTLHAYFDRYKMYLRKEGFEMSAIATIEKSCEDILSYCANPHSNSTDQKRGLVVGDVQSGKTANYLGLINMAYDYGYKIVILLAGATDALRVQTQKRTDQGAIGAISDSIGNTIEYCGVGAINKEHYVVPLTNRANDFKKFIQRNYNISLSDMNKPVVLVVKKQKAILESVMERLQSTLKGHNIQNILIIDDEADSYSINTKKNDNDPTTINKCIRKIFNKFPIASYVGFTATPFANIFINPFDEDKENLNLFPADFVSLLQAPQAYCGCNVFFPEGDTLSRSIRLINEQEDNFLPVIHKGDISYPKLANSLKEAIQSFLIGCVIRTLRGHQQKHRSMMINISRYNDIQDKIWRRVSEYIELLKNIIEQDSSKSIEMFCRNKEIRNMHSLFHSKFYQTIKQGDNENNYPEIQWIDIQRELYNEIKQIKIVVVNSRNGKMSSISNGEKKRFEYEDFENTGARVIAIGGLVLSRGLTLEGLMVSYYSRNAGAYDTLLQMCRWFGYRPKYDDLCRVYLSQTNIDRFAAVREAVADLKKQFIEMKNQGKTPKEFGLMVRESPDTLETTLLVTSKNKMRSSEEITYHLNYGGVYADTSKLSKDPKVNNHNIEIFKKFYKEIPFDFVNNRYMAQDVSKLRVAELIRNLKIPYVNKKFDTESLSKYVEESDIFFEWDVVIAGGDSDISVDFADNKVNASLRSFYTENEEDFIRVGSNNNRILDPGILNAGLNDSELAIIKQKKNPTAKDYLDGVRKKPIFIIYPIDLKVDISQREENEDIATKEKIIDLKQKTKNALEHKLLIAFAIAFPKKESKVMIKYRANKVKLDELTKNMEVDDENEGIDYDAE
ncbi:MAG: Z1 domain-containing protein [Alphaproteobacteria bacterium]|nr:Z1 domain-containing protein [Alphaproteobacteria bacterium]